MGNRHGTDGAPKFNDEMIAEFCKTSGMTENQVKTVKQERAKLNFNVGMGNRNEQQH